MEKIPKDIKNAVETLLGTCGLSLDQLTCSETQFCKKYLTIAEVKEYCGISRWKVYRLSKVGKLQTAKLSSKKPGRVLVDKESLDEWLKSCQSKSEKKY